MNDLANELDAAIAEITPELRPDEVAEIMVRLQAYLDRGKQLKAELEQKLLEYIGATGQEIMIGPVRYFIGSVRETKCRDRGECLQSLLEQFGAERVGAQFLSAGAFRHGAIAEEVDRATFRRLFETTERIELKEGKSQKVKRLQKVDERFVRPRLYQAVHNDCAEKQDD